MMETENCNTQVEHKTKADDNESVNVTLKEKSLRESKTSGPKSVKKTEPDTCLDSSAKPNGDNSTQKVNGATAADVSATSSTDDAEKDKEIEDGDESEGEEDDALPAGLLEKPRVVEGKRERKKTQRLSQDFDDVYNKTARKRAEQLEAATANLQAGRGTALGDIPLIELSLRKAKSTELKILHSTCYCRPGSSHEIRSNLRKFCGFSFDANAAEYEKKRITVSQRGLSDIRDTLRILNLETSGSRELLSERLVDFLISPTADQVKYKGKLPPGKRRKSAVEKLPSAKKSKTFRKPGRPPKVAKSDSDSEDASDIDEGSHDSESDRVSNASSISSVDESVKKAKPAAKKAPTSAKKAPANAKKVLAITKKAPASAAKTLKRRVISDDESEDGKKKMTAKSSTPAKPMPKKRAKKAAVDSSLSSQSESEEDAPLAKLKKPTAPVPPTDGELKERVLSLLTEVNLETTSLRLVRDKIFTQFPGVDLSDKKDFINTVVKQYLATS